MTARPIPKHHWRGYGDEPLPTGLEALDEPLAAFPSWFMRITCDHCGKDRMLNEVHTPERQRAVPIRDLVAHMRHDGCGGRAELLAGIEAASSRPVRRIVLITNPMLQPASTLHILIYSQISDNRGNPASNLSDSL